MKMNKALRFPNEKELSEIGLEQMNQYVLHYRMRINHGI
ncbi:hypothetical protein GYO_0791 [Bacillus spizizenii TU-B-10]|uniref:Uncharacterized protein n=1 Tax=Bacillus spizizenii (strain DSM 15029 / JCM 12233 / NBRC 101239 / NRRL B-23049 / TU-B-10) TaxID=1052585 RepID=G4NR19_BACS4|nr:hypothetical protein GYO_0791 [Bacillus spizizenii TU-B-10]SCV39597.1 hypothetical protein BQ1740_1041 [Bacillus subtilis]